MGKIIVKDLMIIAMKGHPCTGKSTMARRLAEVCKFPVFAEDDVRRFIEEKDLQQPSQITSTATATERLSDLSFGILCQIASIQLQLGRQIIIDSSLHRRAHLDRLLQLAAAKNAELVIVECIPGDRYEWKQRLKWQCESEGPCWYKPSTWKDLQRLLEFYDGCSDYDMNDVWKLVVDTTEYVKDTDLAVAVMCITESESCRSMVFHEWVGNGLSVNLLESESENEDEDGKQGLEDGVLDLHYHELTLCNGHDRENNGDVNCGGCLKPISDADVVYYRCKCNECDLFVHKLCAELGSDKKELVPQKYPHFLQALPDEYSFPETHRCGSCEETSDESFGECTECLFESNLRCALLPSIVHHNCHEHPLTITLNPISCLIYFQCKACGETGKNVSYCCTVCDFASFECHLDCALFPQTFNYKFHRHPLKISTNVDKDFEESNEFYCDVCEKERNPNHWIYYCDECNFTCHLKCMTFDA